MKKNPRSGPLNQNRLQGAVIQAVMQWFNRLENSGNSPIYVKEDNTRWLNTRQFCSINIMLQKNKMHLVRKHKSSTLFRTSHDDPTTVLLSFTTACYSRPHDTSILAWIVNARTYCDTVCRWVSMKYIPVHTVSSRDEAMTTPVLGLFFSVCHSRSADDEALINVLGYHNDAHPLPISPGFSPTGTIFLSRCKYTRCSTAIPCQSMFEHYLPMSSRFPLLKFVFRRKAELFPIRNTSLSLTKTFVWQRTASAVLSSSEL